ncbi:hypothetical protein [Azospirillum sp. TSO22-1]|uniref:hypothetical protein n=1 Tax=Azospirillum sp. TSO22-1 TaxID=716789 RepID=UPI000D614EE8|nr:hypothetical protein [Azospirillum sp. TSO22-1]PWC41177.1 hypothetical protein TSO221_24285 [Azospirillum sp. TSO22-1]
MTRGTLFLILVLAAACAGALGWAAYQLYLASDSMSVHGWLALGLGSLGVALLTCGLMRLVFLSSRGGWDQ